MKYFEVIQLAHVAAFSTLYCKTGDTKNLGLDMGMTGQSSDVNCTQCLRGWNDPPAEKLAKARTGIV